MVAPLMQGALLMGIIYWYSKGLIDMINDYYRGEFNRKLKAETKNQNFGNIKQQSYDLDDMDELLNIEMNKEFANEEDVNIFSDLQDMKATADVCNATLSERVCYRANSKEEFLNILYVISYNYYKMHPFKYPFCWLNDKIT